MSCFEDDSFDMSTKQGKTDDVYLKLRLNVEDLKSVLFQENLSSIGGWKCCCMQNKESTFVPTANKYVTECIISSLNITNAENILSLIENYITDHYLTFSSISLKLFISFLIKPSNTEAHKYRLKTVLDDQLRFHPSCSPHMSPIYHDFMFSEDESFSNLTILEYVLAKLEAFVSGENIGRVVTRNRVSRRCRQPVKFDEYEISKESEIAMNEDRNQDHETAATSKENFTQNISHFVTVLDFIVEVIKHDLGFTLKRGESVHSSMAGELFFKSGDLIEFKSWYLVKIFQIYKNCTFTTVHCSLSELIATIAYTSVLLDHHKKYKPLNLGHCCKLLVDEFTVSIFGLKPTAEAFAIVSRLKPEWLRYHAAHYVIEKLIERKLYVGFVGPKHFLSSVLKKIDPERKLEATHKNELQHDKKNIDIFELCRKDDVKKLKHLHKTCSDLQFTDDIGRTPLHIVALHNSVNCAQYLLSQNDIKWNLELKDFEDCTPLSYARKNAEVYNVFKSNSSVMELDDLYIHEEMADKHSDQKLSSILCKMLTVLIDSTIKIIIQATKTKKCEAVIEDYVALLSVISTLCKQKNIPRELKILHKQLNRINFV